MRRKLKRDQKPMYRFHAIAILALGLFMLVPVFSASAQEEGQTGFSETQLQEIRPQEPVSKDPRECLRFVATFSKPVRGRPQAVLDFENMHMIDGALSFVLDVIPVGATKFILKMIADPQACNQLLQEGSDMSVTVEEAVGEDGLPVLPDQVDFQPSAE